MTKKTSHSSHGDKNYVLHASFNEESQGSNATARTGISQVETTQSQLFDLVEKIVAVYTRGNPETTLGEKPVAMDASGAPGKPYEILLHPCPHGTDTASAKALKDEMRWEIHHDLEVLFSDLEGVADPYLGLSKRGDAFVIRAQEPFMISGSLNNLIHSEDFPADEDERKMLSTRNDYIYSDLRREAERLKLIPQRSFEADF